MMRTHEPTSWLLYDRNRWHPAGDPHRTAGTAGVSLGEGSGIRLAAERSGPAGLLSGDGSLGGLTLPLGMALSDDGVLHLLVRAERSGPGEPRRLFQIKRFDPATRRFRPLPSVGGSGREPRQFRVPRNIAIAGRNLYVADYGNRRVQVFDIASLALRHLWRRRWLPVDVAAHDGAAYILDGRSGRVYRHRPGSDRLACIVDGLGPAGRWQRIALDREGRIYLLDRAGARLAIYDAYGRPLGEVRDAGEVRDRFDAPPVRVDHRARFCLPEQLARQCDRRTAPAPPPQAPLALCPPARGSLVFDRSGQPARMDHYEVAGPRSYALSGMWVSAALDSRIHRCQWHRIELELLALPPGTQVVVRTYTALRGDTDVSKLPDDRWSTPYVVDAPAQQGDPAAQPELNHDFLVQSREGQYLWLRVELNGDGYTTPAVGRIRVHYPRESYLRYLPAIFAADDESRWFLERFLAVFQIEWDQLERTIDELAGSFDPRAVPEGKQLAYLASWLALPLETDWNAAQQRRLLSAAPAIYARRGTLAGLRDFVRVYLENMGAGAAAHCPEPWYPLILEGFRERRRLILGGQVDATLGTGAPLWGPGQVGRLQLGVFAQEGEVRLISRGDPAIDLFTEYAHRFRVFVPASWVRSAGDERMLRRAIEAEKPAHTTYDLCLVEPRLRVGLQSTVGIDTLIGPYPQARLERADEPEAPPSRAPRNFLGYDTVLGGPAPGAGGLPVDARTRTGIDTRLT